MPSKLKKAIAAVKDRTSISLAKVSSYNTSNLDVAVLKATTHDNIPMEDRYVHEIIRLVSSNKIYAAACARAVGKRISRTRNWIVALKSLLLVLRLFQDGDPYFPREVLHATRRGAKILNLSNFRDDSNSSPWDFTAFVRTFALYLDERLDCFLTGKLQRRFTYNNYNTNSYRGRRENDSVRDMKPTILIDKLPYWQRLLERAIATRPTGAAKSNRFVQSSLYAIVQESFELYKDISDGLSILLDSFFHLHYQNCVVAYQICVKARKQNEELTAFYALCNGIGIGRTSEYPSIRTISVELIETLQEFLKDQSPFSPAPAPATPPRSNNIINDYNAIGKSQKPLLLLPAPPNSRGGVLPPPPTMSGSRQHSYGAQSDFSFVTTTTTDGYSERTSEIASSHCTSLEDLISATEVSKLTTPSISIDLEAYPEQFEEHGRGALNHAIDRLSDSYSTQSLPITGSIDLLSLDDCPIESEFENLRNRHRLPPSAAALHRETEEDKFESSSSSVHGWEIVPIEEQATKNGSPGPATDPTSFFGWELDLEPPTMPSPQSSISNSQSMEMGNTIRDISPYNLFRSDLPSVPSTSTTSSSHYYNPFLQDTFELPSTSSSSYNQTQINFQLESQDYPSNNSFGSVPTFEASFPSPTFQATTPTFSSTLTRPTTENDPFALACNDRQLYSSSSMNQQKLLQEQQIWFANQNKIISKRMA